MNKLPVVDIVIKQLLNKVDDESVDWCEEKENLEGLIENNAPCNRFYELRKVSENFSDNKDIRILDYGCGSGVYVILLLLKGYSNVHGIDIKEKFNNKFLANLGFNASFNLTDDRPPFEGSYFDVINSSVVLEHVEDIDLYYQESARILKPGGVCFFHFPQRLKPYDSHSKTWFIHYFPKPIRKVLWDIFARQGGKYLNNYLYLKMVSTHIRIAKKYFSIVEERTDERIKKIHFVNYKGSQKLRMIAFKLMNLRYVGILFIKIFAKIAWADLYLKK